MMFSLILRTATRLLLPLLLLFGIFIMLRGHNLPGGGFVGGLVAASAFALYGFSRGTRASARLLRTPPRTLLGTGLAAALGSGIISLLAGESFMTGLWLTIPLPGHAELALGTPLLFDIGVFLVVIGTVVIMVFSLGDRDSIMADEL